MPLINGQLAIGKTSGADVLLSGIAFKCQEEHKFQSPCWWAIKENAWLKWIINYKLHPRNSSPCLWTCNIPFSAFSFQFCFQNRVFGPGQANINRHVHTPFLFTGHSNACCQLPAKRIWLFITFLCHKCVPRHLPSSNQLPFWPANVCNKWQEQQLVSLICCELNIGNRWVELLTWPEATVFGPSM